MVLWAIIPPAKTVSDRLEMMGEPTNVNNIARMVKEELEQFSDKMHKKFGKKNKRNKEPMHTDDDPEQVLTSGFSFGWRHGKMKAPYNSKDFV